MWYTGEEMGQCVDQCVIYHQGVCMDQDEPGAPGDSPEQALEQGTGSTSRLIWNPFLGVYLAQSPVRMRRRELTSAVSVLRRPDQRSCRAGTAGVDTPE